MDNHHCRVTSSSISCGVAEVYDLSSDPEKVLYALATQLYHPAKGASYAFVMWSDTQESNGVKLYEFLQLTFGLPIVSSKWVENPKTSNTICVWLWEIPHTQFKAWYVAERVKKASKL